MDRSRFAPPFPRFSGLSKCGKRARARSLPWSGANARGASAAGRKPIAFRDPGPCLASESKAYSVKSAVRRLHREAPLTMRSLGPHGERAAPADKLALTADEVTAVRAARFTTAIVLHTVASDWARLVAAGIGETFAAHSGAVVEIVDCSFDKSVQCRELSRLAQSHINAVISIPVGVSGLSHAYREVSKAGKKLILIDNAPIGMLSSADYVAVVSTDNFNMGEIAAALLSPHVANEGVAGILTYNADFFAANEREIAFRKWMGDKRPDVTLVRGRFTAVEDAGAAFSRLYGENPDLDGLFVTWDVPAIHALEAIRAAPCKMPVTTVDLGKAI